MRDVFWLFRYICIQDETRMPRIIALFFLVVMTQALTYPLVIFSVYSAPAVQGDANSLPADFPDNGQTCFFGLGSSEEENECGRYFSAERAFLINGSSVYFLQPSSQAHAPHYIIPLSFQPEKVLSPPPEPVA